MCELKIQEKVVCVCKCIFVCRDAACVSLW